MSATDWISMMFVLVAFSAISIYLCNMVKASNEEKVLHNCQRLQNKNRHGGALVFVPRRGEERIFERLVQKQKMKRSLMGEGYLLLAEYMSVFGRFKKEYTPDDVVSAKE